MTYKVFADGKPKGDLDWNPKSKRWVWFLEGRGKETFPPKTPRKSIIETIKKLCRAETVKATKVI